jgi:hypothetical protein
VSTTSPHPLRAVLERAAGGAFPPVDGGVEVMAPDVAGTHAIVEFTGHAFVLSSRGRDEPLFAGVDAFGGVMQPRFVLDLAGPGAVIGSHDLVLARRGGSDAPALMPTDGHDAHPRVLRARHHRRDVSVLGDERGFVTIGRGLVDRVELSVEVTTPGVGAGRALILGGLATVPHDVWVFAQVAPGNAASVRAILACGFTPIGSEVLIDPADRRAR